MCLFALVTASKCSRALMLCVCVPVLSPFSCLPARCCHAPRLPESLLPSPLYIWMIPRADMHEVIKDKFIAFKGPKQETRFHEGIYNHGGHCLRWSLPPSLSFAPSFPPSHPPFPSRTRSLSPSPLRTLYQGPPSLLHILPSGCLCVRQ